MIMICDQILDWIKIESQELPAEVKPTASITDIMLFLEKNGIKQGYNIGVRDCARLIQEFIAQWSQPHSDIVKPSDQDIENASRDYINDDRFNGLLTTMKQTIRRAYYTGAENMRDNNIYISPKNKIMRTIDKYLQSLNKE